MWCACRDWIKKIALAFNLVFVVTGLGVVVVGALGLSYANTYGKFFEGSGFTTAFAILLGAGILVVVVSGIGCAGIFLDSYVLLFIHAGIIAAVLICEVN